MSTIIVYSKPNCVYCDRAKALLSSKNLPYTENVLGVDVVREDFMATFPEVRTMPFIIIDGVKVGGYTQLVEHLAE